MKGIFFNKIWVHNVIDNVGLSEFLLKLIKAVKFMKFVHKLTKKGMRKYLKMLRLSTFFQNSYKLDSLSREILPRIIVNNEI